MLTIVLVAAAAGYYYLRLNDEIRLQVQAKIAEHYPGLKVSVRSAALIKGEGADEGIEVRGLSIVDPNAPSANGVAGAELVWVDEVFIRCTTELQDLIAGDLQITRVTVRRPTLRATRGPDGSYSIGRLLTPETASDEPPPAVTVEDGAIEIVDLQRNPPSELVLRDINLSFSPLDYSQRTGPGDRSSQFSGSLTSDHVRQIRVEGLVDPSRQMWSVRGTVEGLEISPEMHATLPNPLAEKSAQLQMLQGQVALGFHVMSNPESPSAGLPEIAGGMPGATACPAAAESTDGGGLPSLSNVRWEVTGRLTHGRLDDERLPHPLTDVGATFRLNREQVVVEEFVARSGSATVRASLCQRGYAVESPRRIHAKVTQLELTQELLTRLPDSLKEQWEKYRPYGVIDVEADLGFDGVAWHPDVTARCLDVSFLHCKLPYRLNRGKGIVRLKEKSLEIHLTGFAGSEAVLVDGELQNLGPTATGWCEIKGNAIALDEKLFEALPAEGGKVIRSLRPQGTIGFHMRLTRGPDQVLHKKLSVGVNDVAIEYEKFPYPVSKIRGTLEMVDDRWTFRELAGSNDTGRVLADGYLVPAENGKEFFLRLSATDVPIEPELRDAMKPNIQRVWNTLRPMGMIDLNSEIRYVTGTKKLDVLVRAQPQRETASICPIPFPYRLENLEGEILYADGRVTLRKFKGTHGTVAVAGGGKCQFLDDGGWQMQFHELNVDRLRFDRELVPALPTRLREAVIRLNPQGPMNLRGSVTLTGSADPKAPMRSEWDLDVGFHQARAECGLALENMFGSVKLNGAFDGVRLGCRGELAIDSLICKGWQFTDVRGPIWIDNSRVLFGTWVDKDPASIARGPRQRPRPVTSRLFGGMVRGDGWVDLANGPRYHLQANLHRASLAKCAQEVIAGRQNLRGTITGAVSLQGSGPSMNSLVGTGNLRLNDADIYELPVMIALLKLLSVRPPDQNAFSTSQMDFRILGQHIYFDRVHFKGDAISLLGKGEMDFQQNIRMRFYPIVGRGDMHVPIISQLWHGASQQFMLIHVAGTLRNPEMHREAFPNLNQVLQQLSDDLQLGPEPQNRYPEAKMMPNMGRRWK